jgi:hypothetical protein
MAVRNASSVQQVVLAGAAGALGGLAACCGRLGGSVPPAALSDVEIALWLPAAWLWRSLWVAALLGVSEQPGHGIRVIVFWEWLGQNTSVGVSPETFLLLLYV